MEIKAAVIGSGIGEKHIQAIDELKFSNVKIICETDPKKIKILKKKYRKKVVTHKENDIFKDSSINLVSIASYDDSHYKQILKCIRHNKHIIVEKPMCLKLSQLKEIKKRLSKKKNIKLFSNLVLRVNNLFLDLKKKIKSKDIYFIEADYIWGRKNKLFGWRAKTKNYSITLGAGIHMIDLVNWLINLKPLYANAFGSNKMTKNTTFKKNSFNVVILEYPQKILTKISSNCVAHYDHFHELKIFTKNATYINNLQGKFIYKDKKVIPLTRNYPDKKNRKKLIHNFIECIAKNSKKPIIQLKEQFDLMSICFAIEESLSKKRKVKIKYI